MKKMEVVSLWKNYQSSVVARWDIQLRYQQRGQGLKSKISGVNEQDLATADKGLRNKLTVMVQNELFNEAMAEEIRKRIVFSTLLEEVVQEATFIIEVIPENIQMKRELYKEIEAICGKDTILASNTSRIYANFFSGRNGVPESFYRYTFLEPRTFNPACRSG